MEDYNLETSCVYRGVNNEDYDKWVKGISNPHNVKNIYPKSEEFGVVGGVEYVTATWICVLYSPEELEEIEIYGDPEHEEYLRSGRDIEDGRMEQWDWLKNECE